MTPEWQSRLAAMVQGFHADMAAHDRGDPLPMPPLLLEEAPKISDIKIEVAAVLDASDRPLAISEIMDAIERRHGRIGNLPSVRAMVDSMFADYRITVAETCGRNQPRYRYSMRIAAE